jgi:hypothetical protein
MRSVELAAVSFAIVFQALKPEAIASVANFDAVGRTPIRFGFW